MMTQVSSIVAGLMCVSTLVHAADAPLISRGGITLNLEGAQRILSAGQEKATAMDLKVNIAVVDAGGHLIAFIRMDGARPGSATTALTKAQAAATFRGPTGPLLNAAGEPDLLLNLSLQHTAAAGGGKATPLYGGVPIEVDGQILGAVGVGGAKGEQDAEIARTAIESLLNALSDE